MAVANSCCAWLTVRASSGFFGSVSKRVAAVRRCCIPVWAKDAYLLYLAWYTAIAVPDPPWTDNSKMGRAIRQNFLYLRLLPCTLCFFSTFMLSTFATAKEV